MSARLAVAMLAIALIAAAIGGIAGATVARRLDDDGGIPARGTLVHLGPPDTLGGDPRQPFCVTLHHFCIVQPQSGHPIALYTYDSHSLFREQGCEVRWKPDEVYPTDSPNPTRGLFRDPCGGSVYDITGHRLFGPAPRDLDRFSVEVTDNNTIVDTRSLICGNQRGVPAPACPRAPVGD